jgi:hypothetical protein
MIWPWKRRAKLYESSIRPNPKLVELETAKEILAEVFHARPSEVEEMILIRLKKECLTDEGQLWPATFRLVE